MASSDDVTVPEKLDTLSDAAAAIVEVTVEKEPLSKTGTVYLWRLLTASTPDIRSRSHDAS